MYTRQQLSDSAGGAVGTAVPVCQKGYLSALEMNHLVRISTKSTTVKKSWNQDATRTGYQEMLIHSFSHPLIKQRAVEQML